MNPDLPALIAQAAEITRLKANLEESNNRGIKAFGELAALTAEIARLKSQINVWMNTYRQLLELARNVTVERDRALQRSATLEIALVGAGEVRKERDQLLADLAESECWTPRFERRDGEIIYRELDCGTCPTCRAMAEKKKRNATKA